MLDPNVVYQGLVARGIPPHIAEGILMNLEDESGLDPGINEAAPTVPGSRGGFGLAQWTGPRRVALERFAKSTGRPVDDVDTQLDFLVDELQGPEQNAFKLTMQAGTPGEAASIFAETFLRPAKQHLDRRVAEYSGSPGYGNALRGYDMPRVPEQNALRTPPFAPDQWRPGPRQPSLNYVMGSGISPLLPQNGGYPWA